MQRPVPGATASSPPARQAARPSPWLAELRATGALAWPLIATGLAQMTINATTVMMVGRLGPETLAATALANSLYNSFMVFSLGLVSAVAPMMANARGRRRHDVRELRRTARQGFWAAVAIALPVMVVLWEAEPLLVALGQDRRAASQAAIYMHHLQWGLLPQLFYMVLRSFLAVLERPLWALASVTLAIAVNLGLGACLVFGRLGAPALGLAGAGIANASASLALFGGLVLVVSLDRRFRRYHLFGRFWRADWQRLRELMRLGWPIAITVAFETTIFSAGVLIMGLLGPTAVAAHAIALQIGTLAYMVPTGIAQAATVRVGLARGAGDRAFVKRAGWTAYAMALTASSLVALAVAVAPRAFAGAFIDLTAPANGPVVTLAMSFLAWAALFLLADSMQVVAAGMLRGLYDTRMPMLIAAIGYWVIGLPVGALLTFKTSLGGVGVWIGLASGLGAVGILMTSRWAMRERIGLLRGLA
jgi:MATE family multidrug resistance protein